MSGRGGGRRGRVGLIFLLIGLLLFALYLLWTNPFRVLLEAGRLNLPLFLLSILINDAGLLLFALSWHLLLRGMGVRVSALKSVLTTFISLFVVWLMPIPIGSELIRAYLMRNEEGSDLGKAAASVMIHKAMYNLSFGLLITLAAVIEAWRGVNLPIEKGLLLFVVFFGVSTSIIFSLLLTPSLLRGIYRRLPNWLRVRVERGLNDPRIGAGGFEALINGVEDALSTLRSKPLLNLSAFLMVAFQWSTGSITTWLVAMSLGCRIDFWIIVVLYAAVEFIQQLNIVIPGGLGIVDAGLTGSLYLLGLPLSLSSAISLLTRLVTYWLELLLCAVFSLYYGYRELLGEYL